MIRKNYATLLNKYEKINCLQGISKEKRKHVTDVGDLSIFFLIKL